jgi:hypothetical protein
MRGAVLCAASCREQGMLGSISKASCYSWTSYIPDVGSSAPARDDGCAAGAAAAQLLELDEAKAGALPDALLVTLVEMSLKSTLATLLFARLSAALLLAGEGLLLCMNEHGIS